MKYNGFYFWMFKSPMKKVLAETDLNTDKGKAENKKSVVKYAKWYTPGKEKQYPKAVFLQ